VRRRIADARVGGLSGGLNWRGRRKADATSGNVVAQRCMTRCTPSGSRHGDQCLRLLQVDPDLSQGLAEM
jgi:hypothetical protein